MIWRGKSDPSAKYLNFCTSGLIEFCTDDRYEIASVVPRNPLVHLYHSIKTCCGQEALCYRTQTMAFVTDIAVAKDIYISFAQNDFLTQ